MSKLGRGGIHISGLRGMGGVGKTTLALKLAEHLAARYPDAQFYLDLRGVSPRPLSAAEAMRYVILSIHPTATPPEEEHALTALYRSVLHEQRALLVMDNAKDAAQVGPLIPPASCLLIVTSRQRFALPGLYAKDLDTLAAEDARKLLLKIAPRLSERGAEIATLCDYLPLALRLAASTLAERPDLSPSDYVRRLTDAKQRLAMIEASLGLSYELLEPALQKSWCALAVFPETFTAAAAAAVWEVELDAAQDALGELVRFSVVEWDESSLRYGLHDLVRLFAGERLNIAEQYQAQLRHSAWFVVLLRRLDEMYLQGGQTTMKGLALFDLEWPNIRKGQKWAVEFAAEHDAAAKLCNEYPNSGAFVLTLRLSSRTRIEWLEPAVMAARRLGERVDEAFHLGNLGIAHAELGETRRAIELFERSLEIAREIGDRRSEGNALGNLGIAYQSLGETRRAVEFHEQNLEIARETGDRRGEGNALGNLGVASAALGQTPSAVEFFRQQLEIARGIGHRSGEGSALCNLGAAHGTLGEPRRAAEFFEEYLQIARELGDRRGEGFALGGLGKCHATLGETRQAIKLFGQTLEIMREYGDRSGEGTTLLGLAWCFDDLDDRARAIEHGEAVLRIFEEIEDPRAEPVRGWLVNMREQA